MERIISYSAVNAELGSSLSPNDRCACKNDAVTNGGRDIYGVNFQSNRLICEVLIDVTYYNVVWDPANGESTIGFSVAAGSRVDSTKPQDPVWAGHRFDGWYIGNNILLDQTVTGNVTVTAHWTPLYTVTWDPDGGNWSGSTTPIVSNGYAAGTLITSCDKPTDPTKADYNFACWQYNGLSIAGQTLPSSNITVTATWTAVTPTTYTIRFVDYDHTEQNPHVLSTLNKTWGEAITAPADPTREGYIFSGWASNLSGRTPFNPKKHDVIGDETFTATYGEEIKPIGGTAVTMDNMGQVENTSKGPSDLPLTFHPNGVKVHWWSGPMDGHSSDVGGSDNGISADQSGLNRHAVVSDNITYYHYDGDSCVYEYQVTDPTDPTEMNYINALPLSESAVTTLLTSWTSPNGRFKIESLNPSWIRFAVTHSVLTWASVKTDPDPNKWTYVLDANGNETTLTTYIVIEYYVANNSNANARAGAVKISTSIPNGSSDNNECTITMTKFRTDYSDASTGRHEAGQTYFDEHRTIFYQRGTGT